MTPQQTVFVVDNKVMPATIQLQKTRAILSVKVFRVSSVQRQNTTLTMRTFKTILRFKKLSKTVIETYQLNWNHHINCYYYRQFGHNYNFWCIKAL